MKSNLDLINECDKYAMSLRWDYSVEELTKKASPTMTMIRIAIQSSSHHTTSLAYTEPRKC